MTQKLRLIKLPHVKPCLRLGLPFQSVLGSNKRKSCQHRLQEISLRIDKQATGNCKLVCQAEAPRGASFPAGRKQAKIQLPACILTVSAEEADQNLEAISSAISAGANIVLLTGSNDTGYFMLLSGRPLRN